MKSPGVFNFQWKKCVFLTFHNLICYLSFKISLSWKVLATLLIMKRPTNIEKPFPTRRSTFQTTDVNVACVYMYKEKRILRLKGISSNLNKNNQLCYNQVKGIITGGPSVLSPLWPILPRESSSSFDHINLLFGNFWRIPLSTRLSEDSSTCHPSLHNMYKLFRLILTTSLYMSYIPANLVYLVLPEYSLWFCLCTFVQESLLAQWSTLFFLHSPLPYHVGQNCIHHPRHCSLLSLALTILLLSCKCDS